MRDWSFDFPYRKNFTTYFPCHAKRRNHRWYLSLADYLRSVVRCTVCAVICGRKNQSLAALYLRNVDVLSDFCLYLLLGGAPFGFFYKAVNTLDSMVGYHNDQFEYLGKCSARMDDIFGFIPARLATGCMLLSAGIMRLHFADAWRILCRDRMRTKSPNAGQTESVCAGALTIQLGGDASYFGSIVQKATLGDRIREVTIHDITLTCRLMRLASILAVGGGCLIRWLCC